MCDHQAIPIDADQLNEHCPLRQVLQYSWQHGKRHVIFPILSANFQNSDVLAKYVAEDELSAEEQLRLSFMFALDLRNREFEYFQYTNGLLDKETWLAYRHVILINHSVGLGRTWWNEIGRGIVDPTFAKLIDELLVDAEPDETYKRMATWADRSL